MAPNYEFDNYYNPQSTLEESHNIVEIEIHTSKDMHAQNLECVNIYDRAVHLYAGVGTDKSFCTKFTVRIRMLG